MRDLTDEQIGQLAEAYPNQPRGNAYLVYYNKNLPDKDQNYALGTWANLANLRKIGYSHILPFSFKDAFYKKNTTKSNKPAPQRVVDLSEKDIKTAEGLKQNATPPIQEPVPPTTTLGTNEVKAQPVEESQELKDAKAELQKAQDEGAHHMTIKSLQSKVDTLSGNNEETKAESGEQK
jgi:hypothetical protein